MIGRSLKLLEFLKTTRKGFTSTELSRIFGHNLSAKLYYWTKFGFVSREMKYNPTSGQSPWYYKITLRGKKYLSLRKQLKALLTNE